MRVRSRIVRLLGLLAVLWLAGVPASLYAQAATPTPVPALAGRRVVKEVCRSLEGYTLEALKRELELAAKREAANELFGELIVASTTVQNWTVTEDQLRSQSLGLVRVEGSPEFRNGSNVGEVCVTLTVYATARDFARFEPETIDGRACVSGADLTLRQAQALADEKARLQTLHEYDPRLAQYDPAAILPLLRQIDYLEKNVAADTDYYCVAVRGAVIPIEVDGFVLGDGALLLQDAPEAPLPAPTFTPTANATRTPSATPTPTGCPRGAVRIGGMCATVTPSSTPTATRTPTPTRTATATACPLDAVRVGGACATVTPTATSTPASPSATAKNIIEAPTASTTITDTDTILFAAKVLLEIGPGLEAMAGFGETEGDAILTQCRNTTQKALSEDDCLWLMGYLGAVANADAYHAITKYHFAIDGIEGADGFAFDASIDGEFQQTSDARIIGGVEMRAIPIGQRLATLLEERPERYRTLLRGWAFDGELELQWGEVIAESVGLAPGSYTIPVRLVDGVLYIWADRTGGIINSGLSEDTWIAVPLLWLADIKGLTTRLAGLNEVSTFLTLFADPALAQQHAVTEPLATDQGILTQVETQYDWTAYGNAGFQEWVDDVLRNESTRLEGFEETDLDQTINMLPMIAPILFDGITLRAGLKADPFRGELTSSQYGRFNWDLSGIFQLAVATGATLGEVDPQNPPRMELTIERTYDFIESQ